MPIRHSLYAALFVTTLGSAQAATLSTTLEGTGLSIDTPCAKLVTVTPDPALHGQAMVLATADHQEEIDHLVMDSRGTAHVRTRPGSCWQQSDGEPPTLTLAIRVPPGYPLSVDEAGSGRYDIGALGAALSVDLSGAADITDAAATSLQVDISGSGGVHVARADGAARVDISGHGTVTVDQATMPTLCADLSGAGHLAVSAGHVGRANLETSGVGGIQVGADVDDAHVDLSGVGSVRFAKVNGRLTKDVSGVGSVTVQQ